MPKFRVWAPHAQTVQLQLGETRLPMSRDAEDSGWFEVDVPQAKAGSDYGFRLDGGDLLPDPRSPFQPHGVHGPSRSIDHSSFEWSDDHWRAPPLSSAVFYELHIGTFTPAGTFSAAIERLEHLVRLGITHVELMPVAEFDGTRGWGYDGVDLFAPHHAYGGPDGLKRLVDACHRHGLAVVLDVVYNHLGPSGNYLQRFGPYFHPQACSPWGPAINFAGPGSDEVRRFFVDNALMWLRDYRFDGLRLDAIHAYMDFSAVHFLEQLAGEVKALEAHLGRPLALIAESDLNDARVVLPVEVGGYGIDAQWSDDFHHALHAMLTGETSGYYADFGSMEHLATALRQGFVYADRYSRFRKRRHGRPAPGISGHRLLGYLQNHDQIGNRARGERSSQLMDARRLKIGAAIVLTSPFIPLLFEGEEWGARSPFQYFTGFTDPQLAESVREGRRQEFAAFGWDPSEVPDPQDADTFERSKLDWTERDRLEHRSLLDWHRRLIRLRRALPVLTDGRMTHTRVDYDGAERWILIHRGPVILVANLSDVARRIPLPTGLEYAVALASEAGPSLAATGAVDLPPQSCAILVDPESASPGLESTEKRL